MNSCLPPPPLVSESFSGGATFLYGQLVWKFLEKRIAEEGEGESRAFTTKFVAFLLPRKITPTPQHRGNIIENVTS